MRPTRWCPFVRSCAALPNPSGGGVGAGVPPRLTSLSSGAGCGCKLGPGELAGVLAFLPVAAHPDLLVGLETGDDAAVWRVDDDRALVFSCDFFTPIVDDPYTFGRIAAANAVSDVYAMGGRPFLALNLVCWSRDLGFEMLGEIVAGAAETAREGGWIVAGGHSIADSEPKFGQAVLGEVALASLRTNVGLRPGDHLVLTKALGTGIVATAIKGDLAPKAVVDSAVDSMTRLNAEACKIALEMGATAMTDVTGFGLLGHLSKMLGGPSSGASMLDATVDATELPILEGVVGLAAAGIVSGGGTRNLEWVETALTAPGIDPVTLAVLADPQTSGGLLFGVAGERAFDAATRLVDLGHAAAVIGTVSEGSGRIVVTGQLDRGAGAS